eukprot:TRINITY_DN4710_c0_g1_i1.p1 TRINITY_DN4710_c0_g1~~TRINITY_DN4710_c0_g1_i1.p1  ORF type:complete len:440 (-),score=93.77 TRINITY_DN4710_c0_g1_i1:64-1281(-)
MGKFGFESCLDPSFFEKSAAFKFASMRALEEMKGLRGSPLHPPKIESATNKKQYYRPRSKYDSSSFKGNLGTTYDIRLSIEWDREITHHEITIYETYGGTHMIKHIHTITKRDDVFYSEGYDAHPIPSSNFASTTNDEKFTLVTYNIWNLNSPWEKRLDLIALQLNRYAPDIIAFQEVRFKYELSTRIPSIHQIEDLANKLKGYHYVFQPSMTYINNGQYNYIQEDEGLAIFSKFPIVKSEIRHFLRNFSDIQDEHQRAVLRTTVDIPKFGNVDIFTSHFSLSNSARRRNVVEFLHFAGISAKNQIFVGDFNEEPNSEGVDFLTGKLKIDGISGDFTDGWLKLKGEDIRESWTYTTLDTSPKKRIDFVLYRGDDLSMKDIEVIQNDDDDIQPSDHRGIFSTFILR